MLIGLSLSAHALPTAPTWQAMGSIPNGMAGSVLGPVLHGLLALRVQRLLRAHG